MKTQQSGFTLVEIAIVLVIIGLLLGGVLKGQELIYSAKAKAVINDFRNVSVMINTYQDRFRSLPGDDPNVVARLNGGATVGVGGTLGNGVIEGAWNAGNAATTESNVLWQHLRFSNLMSGLTVVGAAGYSPTNAEGGVIGVESGIPAGAALAAANSIQGRIFVCQDQISGRIAQQVDSTMDNGDIINGSVFVMNAAATAMAVPPLTDATFYTVCVGF